MVRSITRQRQAGFIKGYPALYIIKIRHYIEAKNDSCEVYTAPFAVKLGEKQTIVDPDRNRITIHDLEHEDVNEYTFSDTVTACIYEDLHIVLNQSEL